MTEIAATTPAVGQRVMFDNKHRSWLARAATSSGRYLLLTSAGGVCGTLYTIIDFDRQIRGAMNIVGGGLGIHSIAGPDPAIDEAIQMLEEPGDTWTVSHRNRVPLRITRIRDAR